MNSDLVEQVVNAVLYEGYILYPYRPSSKKNRRERFTFGRIYPESHNQAEHGLEPCRMQTECLVEAHCEKPTVEIRARFLQPTVREITIPAQPFTNLNATEAEPALRIVPELRVGSQLFQTWQEAVERSIETPPLELIPAGMTQLISFHCPLERTLEPILEGSRCVGLIVRRQTEIQGTITVIAKPVHPGLFKITVRISNQSCLASNEPREQHSVLLRTFASTHTILHAKGGEFVSLMDPGTKFQQAADDCNNIGTWPVLIGEDAIRQRDTMLSSPIILYDYPKIAPESPGTLFDETEIDEMLTLRIMTMTNEEKVEMRAVDERARRLLERTECLGQDSLIQTTLA